MADLRRTTDRRVDGVGGGVRPQREGKLTQRVESSGELPDALRKMLCGANEASVSAFAFDQHCDGFA